MGFQRAKTKLVVGHRLENISQGERLHVAATMRIEELSASPHKLSWQEVLFNVSNMRLNNQHHHAQS